MVTEANSTAQPNRKRLEELLIENLSRLARTVAMYDFIVVSHGDYYVQFLNQSVDQELQLYCEVVSNQFFPGLLTEMQVARLRDLGFQEPESWQSDTNFSREFNAASRDAIAEVARVASTILYDIFGVAPESQPKFQWKLGGERVGEEEEVELSMLPGTPSVMENI